MLCNSINAIWDNRGRHWLLVMCEIFKVGGCSGIGRPSSFDCFYI